eukprot:s4463_g2.t1
MQSLRLKRSWSFDTFACTFAVFCLMLSRAGYWSTVPLSDPVISSHETLEIGWLTSTPEPVFLGASRRDKSRGQRITSGSALTRKMTNDSKPSVEASGSRLPAGSDGFHRREQGDRAPRLLLLLRRLRARVQQHRLRCARDVLVL